MSKRSLSHLKGRTCMEFLWHSHLGAGRCLYFSHSCRKKVTGVQKLFLFMHRCPLSAPRSIYQMPCFSGILRSFHPKHSLFLIFPFSFWSFLAGKREGIDRSLSPHLFIQIFCQFSPSFCLILERSRSLNSSSDAYRSLFVTTTFSPSFLTITWAIH